MSSLTDILNKDDASESTIATLVSMCKQMESQIKVLNEAVRKLNGRIERLENESNAVR